MGPAIAGLATVIVLVTIMAFIFIMPAVHDLRQERRDSEERLVAVDIEGKIEIISIGAYAARRYLARCSNCLWQSQKLDSVYTVQLQADEHDCGDAGRWTRITEEVKK